ncbi:MAG: hypothetical protein LBU32_15460 [Clostridiales bacterium]|jgi:hypothetical protein|nr:hypothetical protein [Clostridiales bacterium]
MKAGLIGLAAAAAVLAAPMAPAAPAFGAIAATPTSSTVSVDGKPIAFDSYNINDYNYFKIRDVAFALNGGAKRFAIAWDAVGNAMTLTPGAAYAPTGEEMASKGSEKKTAALSTQAVRLVENMDKIPISAYNIDGYNYFKLRDLGAVLDLGVGWDGGKNAISIDSSKGYVESQAVDALDKAIAEAIIAGFGDLHGGGDFPLQSHITLKVATDGSVTTAYATALYQVYNKKGGKLEQGVGVSTSVAITLEKDGAGKYKLIEFWIPEVGDRYIPSIQKKFPKDLWDLSYSQYFGSTLRADVLKQASNIKL